MGTPQRSSWKESQLRRIILEKEQSFLKSEARPSSPPGVWNCSAPSLRAAPACRGSGPGEAGKACGAVLGLGQSRHTVWWAGHFSGNCFQGSSFRSPPEQRHGLGNPAAFSVIFSSHFKISIIRCCCNLRHGLPYHWYDFNSFPGRRVRVIQTFCLLLRTGSFLSGTCPSPTFPLCQTSTFLVLSPAGRSLPGPPSRSPGPPAPHSPSEAPLFSPTPGRRVGGQGCVHGQIPCGPAML